MRFIIAIDVELDSGTSPLVLYENATIVVGDIVLHSTLHAEE